MEKQLVPQLRFSEFKGNWKSIKIGNIGKPSMCKRIMKDQTLNVGDIPFYKIGTFGKEADAYITNDLYEEYKTKFSFPKKGDILISASGTIGRTVIYDGKPAYFQDSNIVWIANNEEKVLNKLLVYLYENVRWTTENTTIARLYNDNLKSINITIPSIPEQQKIASFLSDVDAEITKLTKKKTLLEQYKKGIMQKIFSQKLRFKDDNGNAFPKWEEKKLGEVATKKSSNISANTIEENSGEFKIYGASGLLKKIDFYREEEPYISIVKDGAGVGRTLLCDAFSSVLGTLDIIKPKKGVNLYFIYCLLNNINFLKFITGSTIPHIYFKDYSTVKIEVPCLDEQTKIANFLSDIDIKIEALNTKIENSKAFKQGLLQKMFV